MGAHSSARTAPPPWPMAKTHQGSPSARWSSLPPPTLLPPPPPLPPRAVAPPGEEEGVGAAVWSGTNQIWRRLGAGAGTPHASSEAVRAAADDNVGDAEDDNDDSKDDARPSLALRVGTRLLPTFRPPTASQNPAAAADSVATAGCAATAVTSMFTFRQASTSRQPPLPPPPPPPRSLLPPLQPPPSLELPTPPPGGSGARSLVARGKGTVGAKALDPVLPLLTPPCMGSATASSAATTAHHPPPPPPPPLPPPACLPPFFGVTAAGSSRSCTEESTALADTLLGLLRLLQLLSAPRASQSATPTGRAGRGGGAQPGKRVAPQVPSAGGGALADWGRRRKPDSAHTASASSPLPSLSSPPSS